MPTQHSRKKTIRRLKADLEVTYTDAALILADDRCEQICELISEHEDVSSYATAVAVIEDPRNQVLCDICGWTLGMICPECSKGCGCETQCSGWRHGEWGGDDGEGDDEWGCSECGAGGGGDPYSECDCYELYADADLTAHA